MGWIRSIRWVIFSGMLVCGLATASSNVVYAKVDDQKQLDVAPTAAFEQDGNAAFWKRDYRLALSGCEKMLAQGGLDNEKRARCLANMAICAVQLDDLDVARGHSIQALKLTKGDSLTVADALAVQAHWLLNERKYSQAREYYQRAKDMVAGICGEWSCDLAPFYEGLAACYTGEGKLSDAAAMYKKVAQLDLIKYGQDDTHFAWSLLSLTNMEGRLGHSPLADKLFKKVFWNFRRQNEFRILEERKGTLSPEALEAALRPQLYGFTGGFNNRDCGVDYISEGIPADAFADHKERKHIFAQWFRERVGREEAPGLAFFNPSKPLKGLIVTVHGLGLHHGSFTPFARKIMEEGYGVVSFDVRGFGTYRNDEVYQRVDLPAAITDLKRILRELRSDYPNVPFILLGESMGGAIVLRLAATAPELVDAVISSVPSGSRFHSTGTALSVAMRLLTDNHEQVDVGSKIIAQATLKPDLRDMWEGDHSARLKLSPEELFNFSQFMGENIKYAQQITKTPVIIFQGFSDNLVKPMGSLAIYQAIANKDKDMVFLGRAEHLIFESGQCHNDVLKAVIAWIDNHVPKRAP